MCLCLSVCDFVIVATKNVHVQGITISLTLVIISLTLASKRLMSSLPRFKRKVFRSIGYDAKQRSKPLLPT